MNIRRWLLALGAAWTAAAAMAETSSAAERKLNKELLSFGSLQAPNPEMAKDQAAAWLKAAGKADDASRQKLEAVWTQDLPLVDRVAEVLALGDADAARLLAEVRDPNLPAPQAAPALLKDAKKPAFYRANLSLAYAKALSNRRVFEEALEALNLVKPEQVVDPSAYLFHKAVAEHALLLKEEANRSITRLLDDVSDAPERYKHLATLMHFDMLSWKEKDLDWVARKMDNIERRLDLTRGGPKTQKIQKEVVNRLDELIKQMENQAKGSCSSNGGACPNGSNGNQPGNTNQPTSPQKDSVGGTNGGPGKVDQKHLARLAQQWGKLPEKERVAAMESLKRDLPPRYREAIETYFKKMAQGPTGR